MPPADRLAHAIRAHRKSIAYTCTALALAGAGSATAVAVATPPAASATSLATHQTPAVAAHLPAGLARRSARPAASLHPAAVPAKPTAHAATVAHAAAPAHPAAPARVTFASVQAELARQTSPSLGGNGVITPADRLLPVPTAGAQLYVPIGAAQYQNATTIVGQALDMHMGIRSAVIAVATAIQESQLQNVGYGTGNSLGLFQQQPDMGWGTAQQIMDPAYAADAFLSALQQYQAGNPGWATQPLYQAAQAVQGSAFPYAYAQWETQAAQLVSQIVMQLR